MNPSFQWVFTKGSNWWVLPDSTQEELEKMFLHDRPGKIVISSFPAPLLVSNCFSYAIYTDGDGDRSGYALARVSVNAQLNN